MDSIKKMIPFHLPPAGHRIIWRRTTNYKDALTNIFSPFESIFFGSGASALAASIILFKNSKIIESPEVLLPAYSCPELVSAIRYAGVKPVFIDLEEQTPFLDIAELESKINKNTLAILAVDLFGIRERFRQLKYLAKKNNVFLIEDSAQYFPKEIRKDSWDGDAVILSFGRGKPVSVLDNGAILFNNSNMGSNTYFYPAANLRQLLKTKLKIAIYNILLNPNLYWLPARMPFLAIGSTKYVKMENIKQANATGLSLLPANIEMAQDRSFQCAIQEEVYNRVSTIGRELILDLTEKCCNDNKCELTRYPIVILDNELMKRIKGNAKLKKYGITFMYEKILPEIPGVAEKNDLNESYPNAKKIASGLITIPIHELINKRDINAIFDIIESEIRSI